MTTSSESFFAVTLHASAHVTVPFNPRAGEFPKAIEEYTEAIKRNPDNAVYYA